MFAHKDRNYRSMDLKQLSALQALIMHQPVWLILYAAEWHHDIHKWNIEVQMDADVWA